MWPYPWTHVCAWARVLAAPRHPWLGCWGVCVCSCARSACTRPLLARVCGVGVRVWARVSAAPLLSWLGFWGSCVFVCALRSYPATPGWGVWCGCVCLGSDFGCAPPLLAGLMGCVCVRVRALLVPRDSWLRCAARVCLLGLKFCLRPAIPGWGVGVCVFVCALCLWPTTPGCSFVVCWLGVALHLFLCRGSLRVGRAQPVCGTRWPLSLGTCSCSLAVAGGVPLWRASWPRVGVPCLVRSGRSRCFGRPS